MSDGASDRTATASHAATTWSNCGRQWNGSPGRGDDIGWVNGSDKRGANIGKRFRGVPGGGDIKVNVPFAVQRHLPFVARVNPHDSGLANWRIEESDPSGVGVGSDGSAQRNARSSGSKRACRATWVRMVSPWR